MYRGFFGLAAAAAALALHGTADAQITVRAGALNLGGYRAGGTAFGGPRAGSFDVGGLRAGTISFNIIRSGTMSFQNARVGGYLPPYYRVRYAPYYGSYSPALSYYPSYFGSLGGYSAGGFGGPGGIRPGMVYRGW